MQLRRKNWWKYILKGLAVFIICWLLLIVAAYLYITINKNKIVAGVQAGLNKKINGAISFGSLEFDLLHNFPTVSIDISDLHLRDSLYSQHKKELLYIKHVYVGFGLYDLLLGKKEPKKITVTDGSIYFFTDSTGYKNWQIIKKDTVSAANEKPLHLDKVSLKNIHAVFQEDRKFKYFSVLFRNSECSVNDEGKQISILFANQALIERASFNTKKGNYLANKSWVDHLHLVYEKNEKKLSIANQAVRIGGYAYHISGDFFLTAVNPHFALDIKTDQLPIEEVASLFPESVSAKLRQFHLSKPLTDLHAEVSGELKYLSVPFANVSFNLADASLEAPGARFAHCSFHGLFNNEVNPGRARDDYNSLLKFTGLKTYWQEFSLESKTVAVYNLVDPYIRLDLRASFGLKDLERIVASRKFDFYSGHGIASVNYAGPLNTRKDTAYDLDGTVNVNNADIHYVPRDLHFRQTNINLVFSHGDLLVKKMNTSVNGNPLQMHGEVSRFMSLFNTDPSKAVFNWDVYSPRLDISTLRAALHRRANVEQRNKKAFFERLNEKLDKFFDASNAYVTLRAEKVIYKNFDAQNISGHLSMTNDRMELDNFSLAHAGGTVYVNASVKDNGPGNDLVLKTRMQDVDVKQLFHAFNNFGMQSLTSKNLQGRFSASIDLSSMMDANNNLATAYNKGSIDFSLKSGRLVDFQPLMDIDKNFLKKRNMSDIAFAELKDKLELRGNDIYVNKMEIQTSALGMFVEGLYSFANNTDLSIQIPFKYMKKHDDNFVPENKGVDAKAGMGVFLRAKDEAGRLKIGYDMLGRFRH
jgi:hypothetical protein